METQLQNDGIINNDYYTDPKILFVLKETNQYNKSLTDFLRNLFTKQQQHKKGQNFQMWHTISKWACGIHTDFKDFDTINKDGYYKIFLQKIAVINLKKTPGGKKANKTVLESHAKANQKIISRQVKEIKPKVIIACGTYDLLISILGINSKTSGVLPPGTKIIKMRHPNRANQRKTYEDLKKKYKYAYA